MSVDAAFAKVLGRAPSESERERLYRLRDALGLRDNDAFWSIVLALEHYDAFFRQYPAQLAEETTRAIETARAAFATAAANEAAMAQRLLSERVAETSVAIARELARRPVGLHRVTLLLAAVVGFGALCVHAGYRLASAERPFWAASGAGLSPGTRALGWMLAIPAGWMVFVLLMPAGAYGVKLGWTLARESACPMHQRVLGASIALLCAFGGAAAALMLVVLT